MPRIVPQNTPLDAFGASFGNSFVQTGQAYQDRIQQEAYQKARLDLAREGLDLDTKRFEFQAEQSKAQQEADRRVNEFRAGQLGGVQEPEQVSAPSPRLQALQQILPTVDEHTGRMLLQEFQEEEEGRILQEGVAQLGQGVSQAMENGVLSEEAAQEMLQGLSTVRSDRDLDGIEKRLRGAQDEHAKIQADAEGRQAYASTIDRQIEYMSQDPNGFGGDPRDPRMARMLQIKHKVLNGRLSLEEAYGEMDRIQRGGSDGPPFPVEALQAGDSLPVEEKYRKVPPMQGDMGQVPPSPTPPTGQAEASGQPPIDPRILESLEQNKQMVFDAIETMGLPVGKAPVGSAHLDPKDREAFIEALSEMIHDPEAAVQLALKMGVDPDDVAPEDVSEARRRAQRRINSKYFDQ